MVRPHGSVVVGSFFAMFTAAGLNSAGSMRLFTNRRRGEQNFPARGTRPKRLREVAREHGGGRHECDGVGGRLRRAGALIRAKEKQPVQHERAAQRAAELVAHQAVIEALAGRAVDPGERAGRVETVVARELEEVAVEHVGARLGDDADRSAGVQAVLRVLRAGLDPELLQRVGNGSGMLNPSKTLLCVAPSRRYATPNDWPPAMAIPRLVVMLRLDGAPVSVAAPASAISAVGLRPSSGKRFNRSLSMTARWQGSGSRRAESRPRRTPFPRGCQAAA